MAEPGFVPEAACLGGFEPLLLSPAIVHFQSVPLSVAAGSFLEFLSNAEMWVRVRKEGLIPRAENTEAPALKPNADERTSTQLGKKPVIL